jgi:molybdenum cofactor cytidylyltransferase
MEKLLEIDEEIAGAIITVCDQPFVTNDVINGLVKNFNESQALIVASRYAETLGVPALFSRRLFSDLMALKNSGGAKDLIKRFSAETVAINFSEGAIDIDTPEDFHCLKTNFVEF